MAIFSQSNEQTKVDFRKYDEEKPNKCEPFQLPKTIEENLKKVFKELNLKLWVNRSNIRQYRELFFFRD